MKDHAKKYLQTGLSIIVTDNNKRSLFPWKKYQEQIITEQELTNQLSHDKAAGLAIICGAISGGLEVIDVDLKNDLSGNLWERLTDALLDAGLMTKLKIGKTKSGGFHLYYRCEVVEGNQKLAMRPATKEELRANPQLKHVVTIETRGEAGYVVAAPTQGYEFVSGKLNVLTADQRDCLLEICRSFNEVFETPPVQAKDRPDSRQYGLSPFDDYNKRGDVVGLLEKHGWTVVKRTDEKTVFKRPGNTDSKSSGDFNHRLNWFSVFTTNSCFQPNKAYLPYAVYAMLECGGDYKEAARRLLAEGYGERRQSFGGKLEREVFKRKQDGMDREGLVTYVVQQEGKSVEEAEEIITTLEKQWGDKLCTFWDVDKNGRVAINRTRLMKFLSGVGGFYIYFYDRSSTLFKLVRIKDGFIEESSSQQVKEFIREYIMSLPDSFDGGVTPDDLLEVVLKGAGTYFSDSFFEFFETISPDFLKSGKDISYFPFKNGIVCITEESVTLKSYGELGKTVWKSRVIDYNITIDQDFEPDLCEYFRFLDCISGGEEGRRNYAMMIIGYLLHTYKDASRPYAIILAEETDNDKDGGGTGKGIFVKALSYLLRTVKLDGKNFKIDKTFALQRVSLDTQLISIEDCDKAMDFEKFNSQITEGSTIEKKNKDELYIDYKDSPKFIFSTNYMLALKGNHGKRRSRVFEFSPFFGPSRTPLDHFGHLMFDDWDNDEWNRFYNLMFFCVSLYLLAGLKQPSQTDKLKKKQVRVNFGDEFLDYWEDLMSNSHTSWHVFNQEYQGFLKVNDWDKKDYSNKRFKKALVETADIMGVVFEGRRNGQNANQHEFRVLNT
jgi:hypothetical protein